ncbi:vacuolar protein sorting-associated protein BRO1 [Ceratobasidium sp. AG-Ba]|nr:vacuolar protein sorting-associated protein BRO1 [Ceratobasidium sp. AG-Ba]QRW08272.1 vacuolar protein sorting-associated protein BRO1 [Ceratobasidium sp. AG-Ba]
MSGYVYELPTTGALSFSELCTDISGSYVAQLANATEARANVRTVLKASKRTDTSERDYLKVVKMSICQPIFSWRTTLSTHTLGTEPPRLDVHGLHAELAFILLTTAYALSNLSAASVASLGTYERDRSLPDAERRTKDDKLTFAIKLLCRAAGIFTHVAQVVIPEWSKSPAASSGARPPDLTKDVVSALAKLALADAQSLTVRKLLTRSAAQSALSPGPPLPRGHPEPSLVAKLTLHTASLYASGRSLADTAGRKTVSQDVRKYLEDEAALSVALAHKWLGVEAGEAGKTGEAIGYLKWAKGELEALKEGRLAKFKKGGGGADAKMKKERSVEELENVGMFLKSYQKVNDSVNFQPVLSSSALQSLIPAGIPVAEEKVYEPPMPAFGPGTPDYVARHIEKLGTEDGTAAETPEPKEDEREYGLKGSYF